MNRMTKLLIIFNSFIWISLMIRSIIVIKRRFASMKETNKIHKEKVKINNENKINTFHRAHINELSAMHQSVFKNSGKDPFAGK